jgi:hypothetical protein
MKYWLDNQNVPIIMYIYILRVCVCICMYVDAWVDTHIYIYTTHGQQDKA